MNPHSHIFAHPHPHTPAHMLAVHTAHSTIPRARPSIRRDHYSESESASARKCWPMPWLETQQVHHDEQHSRKRKTQGTQRTEVSWPSKAAPCAFLPSYPFPPYFPRARKWNSAPPVRPIIWGKRKKENKKRKGGRARCPITTDMEPLREKETAGTREKNDQRS